MKISLWPLTAALLILNCLPQPVWAKKVSAFDYVRHLVEERDLPRLKKAVFAGVNVDATDRSGWTNLCHSVVKRDFEGYEILTSQGARTDSACMQAIPKSARVSFFADKPPRGTYVTGLFDSAVRQSSFDWGGWGDAFGSSPSSGAKGSTGISGKTLLIGGGVLLGVGGIAAALAGGGGGGGGNEPPVTPSDPGNSSGPTPSAPEASDYETAEYVAGGFLDRVSASSAYARKYAGLNVETKKPVRVGVVDNGVAEHFELKFAEDAAGNRLGINFDYGPCTDVNKTTCYAYDSATQMLELRQYTSDASFYTLAEGLMSANVWKEYLALYDADYVYDAADVSPSLKSGEGAHGTHVSGIIAAARNDSGMHGVAWESEILPIKFDPFLLFYQRPISYAVANGAQVVNFSVGVGNYANQSMIGNPQPIKDAYGAMGVAELKRAVENKTVLVFAAGNEGQSESSILSAAPLIDDKLKGLFINVMALDENDRRADYSNACGVTAEWCLAAPGGTQTQPIVSTGLNNGYLGMGGTSMAAPVVTGAVAVLLGAFPYLEPQEVVNILFDTADDLGAPGVDEIYGHGKVNLNKATEPSGTLKVALTNDVNGSAVPVGAGAFRTSGATARALESVFAAGVSALDDYGRAYHLSGDAFVRSRSSGGVAGRRALSRLIWQKPLSLTQEENLSFGFSEGAGFDRTEVSSARMAFNWAASDTTGVSVFYEEDLAAGRGYAFDAVLTNPFVNLLNAWGAEVSFTPIGRFFARSRFVMGRDGFSPDSFDNPADQENAAAVSALVGARVTEDLSVSLEQGLWRTKGGFLGTEGNGTFDFEASNLYFWRAEMVFKPLPQWRLAASYGVGLAQAPAGQGTLVRFSDARLDSFALDARWQPTARTVAGFSVTAPMKAKSGHIAYDLPAGRLADGTLVRTQGKSALKSGARERAFSLYGMTQTEFGLFKAELTHRMNPDHEAGQTDNRVLVSWGFAW